MDICSRKEKKSLGFKSLFVEYTGTRARLYPRIYLYISTREETEYKNKSDFRDMSKSRLQFTYNHMDVR